MNRKTITSIFITVWLLFLSIRYYSLYPFRDILKSLPVIDSFHPSFGMFNQLFILILIVISANGFGSIFWKNAMLHHLERVVFATAFGLSIISFLVLALNFIGLANTAVFFAILLTGFILFLTIANELKGHLFHALNPLALILLLPIVSSLIGALAPPTQYDSLVYHLAFPARYLAAGKLLHIPDSIYFSFPQGTEMLFQFALGVDGDILANLTHWLFLLLTGLGIYTFGARFWNHTLGTLATFIWYFTPAALFLATGTYIDLALTFYVFLSLYSLAIFFKEEYSYWLYFAAFFCGVGLGSKYLAAIIVVASMILLLFTNPHIALRVKIRQIAQYALIVFAVFLPWIIKNIVYLKNPISPWGASLFNASAVHAPVAQSYFRHIYDHGFPINNVFDLLTLPWKITAHGFSFGGAFDFLGLVFLLFVPLFYLRFKLDKTEAILSVFIFVYVIFWISTGKALRFLTPILPFLSILAARGLLQWSENKIMKSVLYGFLSIAFLHNVLVFHWVMVSVDPYAFVIHNQSRSNYLKRKINSFNAIDTFINTLPKNSKVLNWGETRGYYFKVPAITPTYFDNHPLIAWAENARTPRELLAQTKTAQVTHLLVNHYEVKRLSLEQRLTEHGMSIINTFIRNHTKNKFKDAYCDAYEIIY